MENITTLQSVNINYSSQETYAKDDTSESYSRTEELSVTLSSAAVYEKSSEEETKQVTYKPDMDKVNAMIEETDRRLIDILRSTIQKGSLKQIGGLRGLISKIKDGEGLTFKNVGDDRVRVNFNNKQDQAEEVTVNFEITDEAVAKAQADVGPEGYWGAEQTSERFLEFAQALSGGDPSKADMLLDAVKEGFKLAEEIWGSELPDLSQNTLEMTIKKFEAWRDGTEYLPEVATETLVDESASNVLGQFIQEA